MPFLICFQQAAAEAAAETGVAEPGVSEAKTLAVLAGDAVNGVAVEAEEEFTEEQQAKNKKVRCLDLMSASTNQAAALALCAGIVGMTLDWR